ncbi:hypothetical protein CDV36_000587 [Fusarium kuroshium]|uniref:Uncharacterized protein n=2 Tax=Fusarium solani species complex TaxID=232080 RepID=A0A3M2SRJ7_9HYPO|nr:hypothetical protein CDV36_000587 [Fusarium kuroshium]RSL90605.1 hypothetical protein CEP51_000632 [Fusarium floridanum]
MWVLYEGRDRHTWSLSSGPYRLASEPKLASAESDGESPAGSHMEVKFNIPYGELVLKVDQEEPSPVASGPRSIPIHAQVFSNGSTDAVPAGRVIQNPQWNQRRF